MPWEDTIPKPQGLGHFLTHAAGASWAQPGGRATVLSAPVTCTGKKDSRGSCTGNRWSGPAVTEAIVPRTHWPALLTGDTQPKGLRERPALGSAGRQEWGTFGDHTEPI